MSMEAYPIEVEFPDISKHEQSPSGIAYVHTFDSGVPGPFGQALITNLALLGIFAVQHTVIARPAFKEWWMQIVPTFLPLNFG